MELDVPLIEIFWVEKSRPLKVVPEETVRSLATDLEGVANTKSKAPIKAPMKVPIELTEL
jgi:hypothetical protein